jgi:hypothetical protein
MKMSLSCFCCSVLALAAMICFSGCAAPGPKLITLSYTGTPEKAAPATLALARFTDKRQDTAKGALGFRILNDKSRQVFLVQGLDLATTLTNQTQTYLEKKGIFVRPAPRWSPDPGGLAAAQTDADRLLTADINTFTLFAEKKGAVTQMVLKVDITFFMGKKTEKQLTTIPATLSLERTEVNFTVEKVETFFNQALAEILENALALDN